MAARIAEIALTPESVAQSVGEALEQALEAGASVVLIDATGALPERFEAPPGWLRQVTLFELPIVFAFESAVSGGLAELALACDIRVCGEPGALKGRLAGNARARALAGEGPALTLFLGQALDANALLAAGLVSSVTPAGRALEEGRRLATVIASRGPIATRLGKEAIWRGLAQPLEQALRFETDLTLLLQTTKDRAEGVRAFLEKRAPTFTGE
ncbi:MAG: enoyl-CoA hydratase-related protein [Dehalococcoidia bacterium]|jgi:enoyl-CoA hydratase/carnithine racemase